MAQLFKGDENEVKFFAVGDPIATQLSDQKSDFFNDAYATFVLGELLYDNDLSPLANAIPRDIFREAFATIFDAFVNAGSFESYLTVFRNIFGEDVDVEFIVPAPGKLTINIDASAGQISQFKARSIVSNAYVFDLIVNQDADHIVFQSVKGFESQYELEQMLFEMVPAGIYTDINLTIG